MKLLLKSRLENSWLKHDSVQLQKIDSERVEVTTWESYVLKKNIK